MLINVPGEMKWSMGVSITIHLGPGAPSRAQVRILGITATFCHLAMDSWVKEKHGFGSPNPGFNGNRVVYQFGAPALGLRK